MFTAEELQTIDSDYFRMIVLDPYDLTIQSKCTGHYWYLHSTGYPSDGSCIIFHKHRYQHPYHQHGGRGLCDKRSSLSRIMMSIRSL